MHPPPITSKAKLFGNIYNTSRMLKCHVLWRMIRNCKSFRHFFFPFNLSVSIWKLVKVQKWKAKKKKKIKGDQDRMSKQTHNSPRWFYEAKLSVLLSWSFRTAQVSVFPLYSPWNYELSFDLSETKSGVVTFTLLFSSSNYIGLSFK